MKARYILFLVMVLFSELATAQNLELVGLVSHKEDHNVCVRLDSSGKTFSSFSVTKYDMATGQNWTMENADYIDYGNGFFVLPVTADDGTENAYMVSVIFSDATSVKTPNIELNTGERFHWLGRDLKCNRSGSGYGGPYIDRGVDGDSPIGIDDISYYISYSVHANGFLEFVFPENTDYARLYTKYGIQSIKNGAVIFFLKVNSEVKEEYTYYSQSYVGTDKVPSFIKEYDVPINGPTTIRLEGKLLRSQMKQDHMNYVVGRAYFKKDVRKEQIADFPETQILPSDKPFVYEIQNPFASGLSPYYRIVRGSEYATIDGNVLSIASIPVDRDDYIEVEAFQPGNEEYKPSQLYRCRYYVRNIKSVQKDEKLVLRNGEEVDELTVYGDFKTMGQVVVESGFAKVNKLKLKYTFVPGTWNFISFPGNFNLDEISNLNELGYYFNKKPKPYYIREYSTKNRAEGIGESWKPLSSPEVVMNKGYIMGVARTSDNPDSTPVEVTFTIENTTLGVKSTLDGTLNVQLDMSMLESGEEFEVVVSPVDVKGMPLVVKVKYEPKEDVVQPLNFEKALLDARVTYNPNRSGIRLTLPDDTPAKVLVFNRKGKLVKAVRYVSPHLIDIRDLNKGEYDLLIEYGNARTIKSFEVE